MVKTFEEIQAGQLDEKNRNILFNLIFGYIKEEYKQIKWALSLGKRDGQATITSDSERFLVQLSIIAQGETMRAGSNIPALAFRAAYNKGRGWIYDKNGEWEKLIIADKSPRGIAQVASTAFRDIKKVLSAVLETFEKLQEGQLDEKSEKALYDIIFGQVKIFYRQFNWKFDSVTRASSGISIIRTEPEKYKIEVAMITRREMGKSDVPMFEFRVAYKSGREWAFAQRGDWIQIMLKDKTPKTISDVAKEAFVQIKQFLSSMP